MWVFAVRPAVATSDGWWPFSGWVSRPGRLSKGPTSLLAGESEAQEWFEVDAGSPVHPRCVVLDHTTVGNPASSAGHPRQRAFHHGAVLPIHALKLGVLGADTVFTAEPVVRLNDKFSSGLRFRALRHERAGLARLTETDAAPRTDRTGNPGRTRHGLRGVVDGEVIDGESAGNGPAQRHRLDDRGVNGGRDLVEEVTAAISRITQNLNLLGADAGISGDQFHSARRITIGRSRRFRHRCRGNQPRVRLDDNMTLEPVDLLLPTLVRVTGLADQRWK